MKRSLIIPVITTMLISNLALAKGKQNPTGLMHIAKSGSFLSETSITSSNENSKRKVGSSSDLSEKNISNLMATQAASVGLGNNLEIGAKAGFIFGGENKSTPINGTETITKFSGVTDFSIFTKFRLMSAAKDFSNIDLLASISPGISNHKDATLSADGNALRGGHLAKFGVRMGNTKNGEDLSYSLGANIEYITKLTSEDPTSKAVIAEEDGRMNIELVGKAQVPVASSLSVDLGLKMVFDGAFDYTLTNSQAKTSYGASTNFHATAGINFELSSNFFISPNVDYAFKGDRDANSIVADSIEIERSSIDMGLNIKALF